MAGAFSGHLLHAFNNGPARLNSSTVVNSGAMSFDARAHGAPVPSFSPSTLFGFTPFSEDSTTPTRIATLQAKLNKRLGPEYISQRPGPGGGPKLTYAEGWKIINLANEVFGFNGWSSSIVSITIDFVDYIEESKKYNVGVTAIVRVTLKDGAYHEDVGYGMLENGKSKAAALDKCKKEAITDALKRTLRNFGNLLGNCLYDKSYAQEVVKIKVPPARFDKNELYRRPEFEERIPDASHDHGAIPGTSSTGHEENRPETPHAEAQTPSRVAIPPQRVQTHPSTSGSASSIIVAPSKRGTPPADVLKSSGLATPVQTPWRGQRPPPPRAPPPRPVATSPLAQPASTPDRSVSFAEPNPMLACPDSAGAANPTGPDTRQANDQGDDDDPFPLNTQDGELFAAVDLGRPIDFDEGLGGLSMMEASELEPERALDSAARSPAVPRQPQPQVRDRVVSVGSPSSGPSKAKAQNEGKAQPAAKLPSANVESKPSGSGGQTQSRSGPSNTTTGSVSNIRAGPPVQDSKHPRPLMTSVGSPHHPSGVKSPMQHTPRPVAPACMRTASNTPQGAGANMNPLKRSVDVMQASSSVRPPAQGMGLAQREQQHHQHVSARRPSEGSTSEGHDPKRFKR